MTIYHETRILPFSVNQLYELVKDVDSYHEFLPWVANSRIIKNISDNHFEGELEAEFKIYRQAFISDVFLEPPNKEGDYANITAKLKKGPFKHLTNEWSFYSLEKGKTEIGFWIDFKFNAGIFDALISKFFDHAFKNMAKSFEEEAFKRYNK